MRRLDMQYEATPELWMQRVGALGAVPGLLRSLGTDPAVVLSAAGLSEQALAEPDQRIPYVSAVRLLSESVRRTGCDHFGLLVARAWRLRDLGVLGEMMRSSATLGEALATLVVYQQLNSHGGAPYLLDLGPTVELGYVSFHPRPGDLSPVLDLTLGIAAGFVRELCGNGWAPGEVTLPRAEPADLRPYRDLFHCRVRCDAERGALVMPAADLAHPLPGADPALRLRLEDEVQVLLDRDFVPAVYRTVRRLLVAGTPSAEATAQQLALHRRSFARRLQARGLTFQAILDELRYEAARQLLRQTRLPVVKVAGALGYAEASSFNHAFHRWSGLTPSEWRRRQSQPGESGPAWPAEPPAG